MLQKPLKRSYFKTLIKKVLDTYTVKINIVSDDAIFEKEIKTFIGTVSFGKNQHQKIIQKDRKKYLSFIEPTLKEPIFIIKDKNNGYLFVKSFLMDKKIYFNSVVVNIEDKNIVISNHQVKLNKIVNRIYDKGQIIFPADSFSAVPALEGKPQHEATLLPGNDNMISQNILKLQEMLYENLEIFILRLSEVLEESIDFRIDSEFIVKKPFKNLNLKYKKIGEILKKSQYGISIDMNEDKKGYPIYRMNEIHNLICDFEVSKYASISKEEKEIFKLNNNDILFNRTNSFEFVGRTGIYYKNTEDTRDYIFASYLIRLVPNDEIKPEYLNVFLNTKYGIQDIKRRARISINQSNVNAEEVKNIKIPIFSNTFQSLVEKLVRTAYDKLKESKKLYKEAEELLLEELDLKDFQPSDKNIAIKSFKESFEATGRLDSEYYQPKYDDILEKIKSYKGGWDYIANIVNWQKGVEVGSEAYQEKGKGFLRVSDFSKFGIENISKKISNELYKKLKDNFKPQVGDILFTKDGTIGLSYVVKENIEAVISGAFLRLTLKEKYKNFSRETLVLIFNSIVSQMQVEQLSGGAIIAHLKPSDFEKFVIPIIDNTIQEKIEQKIKESFQLKKESKELLDLAVKAVEIAIEKDENEAMELIKETKC